MWRKGQRVRFYTNSGEQIGPQQSNVGPAVAYALASGWSDVLPNGAIVAVTGTHFDPFFNGNRNSLRIEL